MKAAVTTGSCINASWCEVTNEPSPRRHLAVAERRVLLEHRLPGVAAPAAALGAEPLGRQVPVAHVPVRRQNVWWSARRCRAAHLPQAVEAPLQARLPRGDLQCVEVAV